MNLNLSAPIPAPIAELLSSPLAPALGLRLLLTSALLCMAAPAKTTQGSFDKSGTLNDGVIQYQENTEGVSLTVTKPYNWATGSVIDLEIPEWVIVSGNSMPVTAIGDSAFDDALYSNNRITGNLVIPSGVRLIGRSAFRENSMTSVTLPDTVSFLGDYAFDSCTSLQSINIPKSLKRLGYWTFFECTSLSSVSFSEGLVSIGSGVFCRCTSLAVLNLPNSLVTIEASDEQFGTFQNCDSLRTVILPNALGSIGDHAFEDCSLLESVVFPRSLRQIGGDAFDKCGNLKKVSFLGTLPSIDESDFGLEKYPFPRSNFRITISCRPGKGYETFFTDTDRFKIEYLAPDIAVFSSSGTELRKNAIRNFGGIQKGKESPTVTFKIRNAGSLPLKNIRIANSGGNRLDFKIVAPPSKTLASGATTTFKVRFSPSSKGERGTTLEINSNDPDEKNFKIKLAGRGF